MIDINLITDREIKRLNKRWFGRSWATDVIAFGYGKKDNGEIFISLDAAKRQALERFVLLQDEVLRLIVHGVTHINGYDDLDLRAFKRMREREWERLIKII
jgi:probable rRNA maturation factor